MANIIVVTGATGTVGGGVVEGLRARGGVAFRAMARSEDKAAALRARGVEVAMGDLDDPRSLLRAFEGADTLFLAAPASPLAPAQNSNAIWAAGQAGVKRVVRLSAIKAAHDAPTRNGRWHALSDAELLASGLAWTILKPHAFQQNLLRSAATIKEGVLYAAQGERRMASVDTRDVSEMATSILVDGGHDGATYTPTGPASITYHEVAAALSAALGRPVRYQAIPLEKQIESMRAAGLPPTAIGAFADYAEAYANGWGDFTTDDVPRVLGRPARSIADFARDFAAAFAVT